MSESPLAPFIPETECDCESAYAEDEDGNCTSAELCHKCLVRSGRCECSQEAQCSFCAARDPFQPTAAENAAAEAAARETYELMDRLRAEWHAEMETRIAKWEYDYLDLHCEGGDSPCDCRECLLSPNAQQRLNEGFRVRFQVVLELPLWYEAWKEGRQVHKDPTAWCFKKTWKLVWNARRLE